MAEAVRDQIGIAPGGAFPSVLFDRPEDRAGVDGRPEPALFGDLNLDQIVASITAGRDAYALKPFFYAPLQDVGSVTYRHEIFRDLDVDDVAEPIRSFARKMRSMREHLAQANKLRYRYQKESWSVDAVEVYANAVQSLADDLATLDVTSRGLRAIREHVAEYVQSERFTSLVAETAQVKEDLAGVRYALLIQSDRVSVRRYESEPDYAASVTETFQKFQRGAVEDYRVTYREDPEMDHVEAGVLDRVALLFPEPFRRLDEYCARHADYFDPVIAAFDREVQFYLAYLEHLARLRAAGLAFCYPRVSERSKEFCARETFDLALAGKLVGQEAGVVTNDFELKGPERIFVVTGPNQGGKTTFARTFGQLHHLAKLGCLIPGTEAQVFLCDQVFTHFERAEQLADLRGKLQDDLIRVREILDRAGPRSVLVMNEAFTSTTLRDALFLSTKVLDRIIALDLLCVWVTFVDELASMGPSVVSLVSTVRPDDPAVRTFKIVPRRADGRAYAEAIAAKHGLSHDRLRERLKH